MDIQGSSNAAQAATETPARSATLESAALERRNEEDSFVERSEPEASATAEGVGENVDISA